jgi:hypothetical protein
VSTNEGGDMREKYYYPTQEAVVDGVKWYRLNVNKASIMAWIESQDQSMWNSMLVETPNIWRRVYDVQEELYTAMKLKFTE